MSRFNLEEILPDVAFDSARLPRRQAGSSPQDTAVTMLADYTLRTRAWLPSAAIVALLAESNVSIGNARTTISRLARRGVLESCQRGRRTFYRLTQPAANSLSNGGRALAGYTAQAESWDGCWTLIAFSLSRNDDAKRRALRGRLRWMGFTLLYDGLWISPHSVPQSKAAELAEITQGAMTVFRAHRIEFEAIAGRDPLEAWDIAAIGREYQSYVDQWSPLLSRVRSGDFGGAAAVRARTEVLATYRRFVVLDPRLPMRLMPPGWPRERAREVFVAVYDGLAESALRHVSDVVARFTDGPQPDIRTHTVAELRNGVPGDQPPTPAPRCMAVGPPEA